MTILILIKRIMLVLFLRIAVFNILTIVCITVGEQSRLSCVIFDAVQITIKLAVSSAASHEI
jgi:hypothetical protein